MGVQELMLEHLKDLPTPVKKVLLETILAEQEQMDLDRPRGVKDRIKEVVEKQALIKDDAS